MVQDSFDVFGLIAADAAHPGTAVATARAGGIGLLDLAHARNAERAAACFDDLLLATDGRVGLRVDAANATLAGRLIASAGDRPLTLILCGTPAEQALLHAAIAPSGQHRVLAELTDAADADAFAFAHHGLVARGHEAGGWVGADTSYILAQKLLGKLKVPVHFQGGIGVHSAAALRAMGAAGVIFDDQLLLLAESPLPESLQNELARLNGAETRLFGELIDQPCRVWSRPGTAALKAAEADNNAVEAGDLALADWRSKLTANIGWSGGEQFMPIGQGIGMAATYRSQYRSVGRFIQAVRRASLKHVESAVATGFMAPGGALAKSHGTTFPIAQGPMTRVSDSPEFAYQVSKNGALPFLALALYRGPQVLEMLQQTKAKMTQADGSELPWGVGMLGFVPHSLREEQIAAVWQCKPTYALIAGGRPDQAALFEKEGIPTYIHAPAPALLKMYVEQGAKRFVFEGRECGGHIGPLASFPLWEQMIEVLLADVTRGTESGYHILFAGGIHNAASGAMLAALAAPLAARGMKVGCIIGTAYLFTQEIVDSGAVVKGFRDAAISCDKTVNFETGPGHSTRCVDTPFFREFRDARKELLREGVGADELRDRLEDMNMGRMRVASKGLNRDATGQIVEVSEADQYRDGMFMIGQVATMRDDVVTLDALHREVTDGGMAMLKAVVGAKQTRKQEAKPSDIAIVGIGTLLPKATHAEKYWENILDQVCVIGEVPKDRWDWNLYFDADRRARDKVYSRWGGFLDEVPIDPIAFGIPPKSMKAIDPMQLLTLEVARRGLADAGMADGDFDRENTSVILGAGGGLGDLGTQYAVRAELPRFVDIDDKTVWERLPEWTEESFAGTLLNVAAGRVTNRMDFGGLNFTIDAACASSLAAISIAVNELESGRTSVAIAGGIDTVQSPFGFLCFSKTQALSPNGKPKTFDTAADGIAISEGLAVVVLKRLADAEAAGDRIYAVIKSVAGSSDGRALGLTAPRPEGQKLALKRAYQRAGFSPATLGMAEAHGTGTPVGDRAEARTITESLIEEGAAAKTVAISSVKTILGHTKASAGVAGLIKVALSLHHRALPAHYGVDKPIDTIADPQAPVYLLKDARPWIAHPDHPRRGGVSAFGFGGTNFHAVLEEYRGGYGGEGASGAARWPQELFVFRAKDEATLLAEAQRFATALRAGSNVRLRDLAWTLAKQAESRAGQPVVLALVAKDFATLQADLDAALASLGGSGKPLPQSVRYAKSVPNAAPQIGFLFPGQGSQYVNMGREAALYIDDVRAAFEFADATLRPEFPALLSRTILPPAAFDAEAESAQAKALTDTRLAQPAIGTVALGYIRLAARLGLKAQAAAGHSYGEYAALHATGCLSASDFLKLSAVRGRCMADAAATSEKGAMAAIQAKRDVVAAAISGIPGVKIANHNAPEQAVISGPAAGVEQAAKALEAQNVRVTRLAVSGAFHTELVASAQTGLSAAIAEAAMASPQFAVYSNTSGQAYPTDVAGIRKTLDGHLLNSVEFVAEIEAMYAAGVRLFVELGPKGTCANMARATLAGRDASCVSLDGNGGGIRGLLLGLAELTVAGVPVALTRLFDGRDAQLLDLSKLADLLTPDVLPKHAWLVSGGCARPQDDAVFRTGKLPAYTVETLAAEREKLKAARTVVVQAPAAAATSLPAPAPTPAAITTVSPALGAEAMAAYQQTMRQFLALQERVVTQFLGGAAAGATAVPAIPAAPMPMPIPTAAAPVVAAPVVAAPAPLAATPARMPAAAPVAHFDAAAALLAIVADRTGYPTDMLGLTQDLEAELGIDSIKRVEILGAFQKALPAAAGDAMQAGMERYTRARTLNAILETAKADLDAFGGVVAAAVAPVIAAARAPVAAALDRGQITATLLGIVADRTGYPTDMLGLEQDLEAELGIDSIKRVEILGALQKALPGSIGDAMQAGMERFTRARSLTAILDAALTLVPAGASVSAAVAAPMPASAHAAARYDRTAAQSLLLGIVADRTGYPTDMLGLEQDLEAELGIDSIKRVEILGAFQKALPASLGDAMQAGMERFTRARSLTAILDAAEALVPAASAVRIPVISVPVAAAAESGIDAMTMQAQLLGIVAERTGYPTDMLGLEQDLEAELGIDSIKRVEILGAFQKALPGSLGDAMQAGMERFTRARSLTAILDAATALAKPLAAVPAAVVRAVAQVIAPTTATAVPDRAALTASLLDIVAERTGYPTDMLGLEQDLEAELGIDSIKRVEILGALQKTLPAALGDAMQAGMERFTRARSLTAILDALAVLSPQSAAVAAVKPMAEPTPAAASAAAETIPRYAPRARRCSLPKKRHAIAGLHVLTADADGVANQLAARITAAGGKAAVITAAEAADPATLKQTFDALRRQHGRISGLVHLAPLTLVEANDLASWKHQSRMQAKALFWLIQQAMDDLAKAPSVALAASRFGGSLSRETEGPSLPQAGAAVGLFNCAVQEIPTLRARLVDFEANATAASIVDALFDELTADDARTEIGYANGQRHGYTHAPETLADHPFAPHLSPNGDWVVLITGGARGITAEIAEELARPGMRLVLLGRTPLPGAEAPRTATVANEAELKKILLADAVAAGLKPTPVELARQLSTLLAGREILGNIAKLTAAGAVVDYRACDVRNPEAFGALIDAVYAQYGRIDAVLHGAGVIEDKRIPDKTPDSFDRVYDTKVDSAWVLATRLKPESLQLLALFTSVSGRFGNTGQSDYAAANETLNRLAWQLQRRWNGVRVISINWGPWDAGMASQQVRDAFRARGIVPIPVPAGRRWFMDELAYGPRKDVELVAGEGPWDTDRAGSSPAVTDEQQAAAHPLPLIRRPLKMGAGGAVVHEHTLSLKADPYLTDHRLDGKPVLPAATALEYIAQFAQAAWPEWQVAEIRDLRAYSGIVLDGDGAEKTLLLKARSSTHSDAGSQAVTIEIHESGRKSPNYRASVILLPKLPDAPMSAIAPMKSGVPMNARQMYADHLFHGPQFQFVTDVAAVGADGIDATVVASTPRSMLGDEEFADSRWLFDFGLIDTAPQLALVWSRVTHGKTALPSSFGRVVRYGSMPVVGRLTVTVRIKPATHEAGVRYDMEFVDERGRVRLAIIDAESTMSAALNRLAGNS